MIHLTGFKKIWGFFYFFLNDDGILSTQDRYNQFGFVSFKITGYDRNGIFHAVFDLNKTFFNYFVIKAKVILFMFNKTFLFFRKGLVTGLYYYANFNP